MTRPDFGDPFTPSQQTQQFEPAQVGHIRKNASYLLVGGLTDRLFEAVWFAFGLWSNLLVVLPWFLSLVLCMGRWHFLALSSPLFYWVCLASALYLCHFYWPYQPVPRDHSLNWLRKISRRIGWLVLSLLLAVVLLSVNFAVEIFRDQFRLNEVSLFSTVVGLAGTVSGLGVVKNFLPVLARSRKWVWPLMLSAVGFAFVYVSLLLGVNWIVYGNPLEITRFLYFMLDWPRWSFALIAISSFLALIVWGYLTRANSADQKHNLLYSLPLLTATGFIVSLSALTRESLSEQANDIKRDIGELSRPLGVFANLDVDKLALTEKTKSLFNRLRVQRERVRMRQEYVSVADLADRKGFSQAAVETYGATQSFIDNAAELWDLERAEKFAIRESIGEKSREILRRRARLALGAGTNLSDDWNLAKPLLIELTVGTLLKTESVKFDENADPGEFLSQLQLAIQTSLNDQRVNSVYQTQFVRVHCPELEVTLPTPTRQTSFFPGTARVFFDGLEDEESQSAITRAIGNHILTGFDNDHPLSRAFTIKHAKIAEQIEIEAQVERDLMGKSGIELLKLRGQLPHPNQIKLSLHNSDSQTGDVDRGERLQPFPVPNLLELLKPNVPNTHLQSAETFSTAPPSTDELPPRTHQAPEEMLNLEELTGQMARRILIERALFMDTAEGAEAVELLSRIQTPIVDPNEELASQLESYSMAGMEKFTAEELALLSVAPFVYPVSTPSIFQRIDYAASAVAYSDHVDLDLLGNLRSRAYSQVYWFKSFFVFISILLSGAITMVFVNVNKTSAHEYYRSKLHNTFLTDAAGIDLDVKMSAFSNPSHRLPFLLINTVVNLQGSSDLQLRDRKSDLFLISPLYSGSRTTGFAPTKSIEAVDTQLRLSTAVAISAAAVSPNMGRYTSAPLVWLMSLLNVRLGYWIPNVMQAEGTLTVEEVTKAEQAQCIAARRATRGLTPVEPLYGLAFPGGGIRSATFNLGISQALANSDLFLEFDYLSTVSGGGYIGSSIVASMYRAAMASETDTRRLPDRPTTARPENNQGTVATANQKRWSPPPVLLLKEMLSALRETDAWLNLSDGGHVENLAVFELLERRCGLIVVGNPEASPTNPSNGIGILTRLARTELGVQIDFDLEGFDLNEKLVCKRHWIVGKIHYPASSDLPESTGYIVILRASLTGDEDAGIREYKERCPLFPHEPTTDQFFDVGQFEAYRLLGIHVAQDFLNSLSMEGRLTDDSPELHRLLLQRVSECFES